MAIPRVFISSTCYDLKYIRENLKYFVTNMGYEPILSDEGDVFYNPEEHTHDSCLNEVGTCQLFVLIIGGRYGGKYRHTEKSITNKEYETAISNKIPVFTLVEKNVLSEHLVYQKNKGLVGAEKIVYPNVDNIKIFEFIDEVRRKSSNNAFFPFSNFSDIESYLKKQWAGMMYNFLTKSIERKTVTDLFEEIHQATEKIEFYTKQVAVTLSEKHAYIFSKCQEILQNHTLVQDLKIYWKINATPYSILRSFSLDDLCNNKIVVDASDNSIESLWIGGPPYKCSQRKYQTLCTEYSNLRNKLLCVLQENHISDQAFLMYEDSDTSLL